MNFFFVFEGSFLEAPQVVLFHATVIYYHYGIEDASFFILECVTRIQSSIQPEKFEKWIAQVQLSRSRVTAQHIMPLIIFLEFCPSNSQRNYRDHMPTWHSMVR